MTENEDAKIENPKADAKGPELPEAARKAMAAHRQQQIANLEYVRKLATTADRLISQASFEGAKAAEVAEVLNWLKETVRGSERQLVMMQMPAMTPKPELV